MNNISLSNEDQFFRYKMPKIIIKQESSGNGIKTAILNMKELSSSLQRDPSEINKFVQIQLNTSKTWNQKQNKLILKGGFSLSEIDEIILSYIKTFVLCNRCSLPETVYRISQKSIKKKCAACGYKSKIIGYEKMLNYISKNQ